MNTFPIDEGAMRNFPAAWKAAGRLGLDLPLAVGTMYWGDSRLDRAVAGKVIAQEEIQAIRELADSCGRLLVDTAEGYGGGSSERRIGGAGFASTQHLLASKFLPTLWRWGGASVPRAIHESNRRLRIDVSPLSFIHSPVHPRDPSVWIRGAARAKRQGILRNLGVSNFDAEQLRRAKRLADEEGIDLLANQILMNPLCYASPRLGETLAACAELDVAVLGYGPVGQGLLSDGMSEERFASNRFARRIKLDRNELEGLRKEIASISAGLSARGNPASMAQVCIAWSLSKGVIPLVGTRSVAQLEDTLGAFRLRLSHEDIERLDRCTLPYSTFERSPMKRALLLPFISLLMIAFKISGLFGPAPAPTTPNQL